MIKEFIAEAATVEEAMSLAKAQLAAPETADIKIEVLAQPKKKVLGLFGGSPARVKASYEEKDPAPKYDRKPAETAKPARKPYSPAPKKSAAAKPAEKTAAPAPKAAPAEAKAEEAPALPALPVRDDDPVAAYIKKIVSLMGLSDIDITYSEEGKNITYDIACDGDQGLLIGRRGETLDSLQYLARLAANRNGKDYDRVAINVGNYREKREASLRALAKRSANQVMKYGRNLSLEPMNPYERRIIHTAIQEIEGVQSFSVGADSSRRVVIALQDGYKPSRPSDGYNRRGRGGYNNRGKGGYNKDRYNSGRGGYTPKEPSENSAPRAPKNDAAGSGLYGKIEVKSHDKTEED